MKTGNGSSPNPRKIFQGGMRKDDSNMVSAKAPGKFSAKSDSMKSKGKGGK